MGEKDEEQARSMGTHLPAAAEEKKTKQKQRASFHFHCEKDELLNNRIE